MQSLFSLGAKLRWPKLIHGQHRIKKGGLLGGVKQEVVRKKQTILPHGLHTQECSLLLESTQKTRFEYLATLFNYQNKGNLKSSLFS